MAGPSKYARDMEVGRERLVREGGSQLFGDKSKSLQWMYGWRIHSSKGARQSCPGPSCLAHPMLVSFKLEQQPGAGLPVD